MFRIYDVDPLVYCSPHIHFDDKCISPSFAARGPPFGSSPCSTIKLQTNEGSEANKRNYIVYHDQELRIHMLYKDYQGTSTLLSDGDIHMRFNLGNSHIIVDLKQD